MVKRQNPNWLCKPGFHKWRNYGELAVVTWEEPHHRWKGLYHMWNGFRRRPSSFRFRTRSRAVFSKRECLRCGTNMKRILVKNADGTLSCVGWQPLSQPEYEKEEEPQPKTTSVHKVFAKYFVHGVAFSLLFLVLFFMFAFLLVFLVAFGAFIGLIIGLGILMLIVGGLNSFLADVIWGIETNTSFWSLLLHGFVLFLILILVNGILVMVPNLVFPGIATTVITFIIGAFAGGFVGKAVATWFPD